MDILIKGMEKPISCEKCPLCYDYLFCSIDDSLRMCLYNRHPNCPLIEIVRCGECKHCEKRETAKHILINYCEAHGISVLDTDYCNWGERRADYTLFTVNKPKGIETSLRGDGTVFHQRTQVKGE